MGQSSVRRHSFRPWKWVLPVDISSGRGHKFRPYAERFKHPELRLELRLKPKTSTKVPPVQTFPRRDILALPNQLTAATPGPLSVIFDGCSQKTQAFGLASRNFGVRRCNVVGATLNRASPAALLEKKRIHAMVFLSELMSNNRNGSKIYVKLPAEKRVLCTAAPIFHLNLLKPTRLITL